MKTDDRKEMWIFARLSEFNYFWSGITLGELDTKLEGKKLADLDGKPLKGSPND